MTSWREKQLGWFASDVQIQQDCDLIEFIGANQFTSIMGIGDVDFLAMYNLQCQGQVDFCIYIANSPYTFDGLVSELNELLASRIKDGGVLYLAVNDFLGTPGNYISESSGSYKVDLVNYFKLHINARLTKSFIDENDDGTKFNWTHPLTRLYFKK